MTNMKNLRTIKKAGVAGLGLAAIVVSTVDLFAENRRISYSYPEEQNIAIVVSQLSGINYTLRWRNSYCIL